MRRINIESSVLLPGMAFDASRKRTVLPRGPETWEWDGTNWIRITPIHYPSLRSSYSIAYDPLRKRTVLFGGTPGGTGVYSDTWEWDGVDWTQLAPSNSPPARSHHGMAHDSQRGRIVLFGGNAQAAPLSDTWEWNGSDWSRRTIPGEPSARASFGMVFDARRSRTLLFGGATSGAGLSETWELYPRFPASFRSYGQGCAGTAGEPDLTAPQLPWLGDDVELRLAMLPRGNSALVWLGLSRTSWFSVTLPVDLAAIGMPGCALRARPDFFFPVFNLIGSGSARVRIPQDAAVLGASFFSQGFVADRGANAFGATVSNAAEGVIGSR